MIWSLFVKKLIRSAIQAVIAVVGAEKLAGWGVTIDQTALIAAAYAGLEGLRQVLKRKLNLRFL